MWGGGGGRSLHFIRLCRSTRLISSVCIIVYLQPRLDRIILEYIAAVCERLFSRLKHLKSWRTGPGENEVPSLNLEIGSLKVHLLTSVLAILQHCLSY